MAQNFVGNFVLLHNKAGLVLKLAYANLKSQILNSLSVCIRKCVNRKIVEKFLHKLIIHLCSCLE